MVMLLERDEIRSANGGVMRRVTRTMESGIVAILWMMTDRERLFYLII